MSAWWQAEHLASGLQVALDQVNEARRRRASGPGWELDSCRDCFGALNRLWTTWYSLPENDESALAERRSSESKRLSKLLGTLPDQSALLGLPSVEEFASFVPPILSHGDAGMMQLLAEIPPEVREQAAADHDRFKRGWRRWRDTGSKEPDVVRRLSRAVLVVRNILAHGEKTRHGPDHERKVRNRAVAKVTLPLLEDTLDVLLDRPSTKFAAYGTLRPGQPNHDVLNIPGSWAPVTLSGYVYEEAGLPAFTPSTTATTDADLLVSLGLPSTWGRLDEFEGDQYERDLVLYR